MLNKNKNKNKYFLLRPLDYVINGVFEEALCSIFKNKMFVERLFK